MAKIDMPDYPDNSQDKKEIEVAEEREHKGVIEGTATAKKKGLGKRFSESFFSGDLRDVLLYVGDIAMGAAKDAFCEMVNSGMYKLIYGDDRKPSSYSNKYSANSSKYHDYGKYSREKENPRRQQTSYRAHRTLDFDDYVLETRRDAEKVLDYLYDKIRSYKSATVADFYDAIEESYDYTANKYGWYDLDDARIRKVSDGYLIILPPPEPLT